MEKYTSTGVLNDVAYAKKQIESLKKKGRSLRRIQSELAFKGVPQETLQLLTVQETENMSQVI